MTHRSLKCSFCRRREQDVDKLVAGPRVYICDRCVAIAMELMNAPGDPSDGRSRRRGLARRIVDGCRRLIGARHSSLMSEEIPTW